MSILPDSDLFPDRGEVVGSSYATRAPHVQPEFLRFVRHEFLLRVLSTLTIILCLATASCGTVGGVLGQHGAGWQKSVGLVLTGFAGLGLLLTAAMIWFFIWVYGRLATAFKNGLLSPGVVVFEEPLTIAVLVSMNTGMNPNHHGLKQFKLGRLPAHVHNPGTRLPCVCMFLEGNSMVYWGDFDATPISYGTGEPNKIRDCESRIEDDEFQALQKYVESGWLPKTEDEIALIDENGALLRVIRAERPSLRESKDSLDDEAIEIDDIDDLEEPR